MINALLAVDDGIFQGNYDVADLFFLIAAIVFGIALVVRLLVRPMPMDMVLIAAGLFGLAVGWLLL